MNGEGSCRRRVLLVSAVQMMKVLWPFGIALRREVSSRLGAALAEDCLFAAGLSNRANGAAGSFGSYGIFGAWVFGPWEALADA
jgi:hypothetical protein